MRHSKNITSTLSFLRVPILLGLLAWSPCAFAVTYDLTTLGAVCDGTTDDWAAIQTGLDLVKNGGTLNFPAGQTCFHSQTLTINNGIGFVLEGHDATLEVAKGRQGLIIKRSHGYTIRNLTFDGNRRLDCSSSEMPACYCDTCSVDLLLLRGSTRTNAAPGEVTLPALLSNVETLRSTRAGIRVRGYSIPLNGEDNPTTDLTLDSCSSYDSRINGMAIGASQRIDVLGGTYAETGAGSAPGLGELPGAGIDVESELGETTQDVTISGVTLSDNYGAGLQLAASDLNGLPDSVTLSNSTLRSNLRAAIRIKATNLLAKDNLLEDYGQPSFDQDAAIVINGFSSGVTLEGNTVRDFTTSQRVSLVETGAADVVFEDNHFEDIETGEAVIFVSTGATDVRVIDNAFEHINVSSGSGAAIHHKAADAVITGNGFHDLGYRGVWSTADGAEIAFNTFTCMRGNAIWAAGDDAKVDGNALGLVAAAGTVAASDAVIRSRGQGGTVSHNSLICVGSTQRGIVLDSNPDQVLENDVTNCHPLHWLQFLSGTGATIISGNVQTISPTGLLCSP